MLNTDKVKRIMRAKHGSQIPKFLKPPGPLVLELQNPFMIGSIVATPGIPGKLENPIKELEMELSRLAILNTTGNQKSLLRLARGLARGTHMVSNGEVVLDGKQLVKNIGNAVGDTVGTLAGFVKDFSLKNPNLASMGMDALGNMFDRGVTNNSGTLKIFNIGDTVANGLMMVNPVAGLIGKGVMTAAKGVNNIFGKKTRNFSTDTRTVEEIGGSYGGSVADINEASSKANTKYGLFSSGSRKAANRLIDSADYLQDIMTGIADDVRDQRAMINDYNYLRYNNDLMGGYDQRYIRAAKSGMKLLDKINFVKLKRITTGIINVDTKEINWEPEVIVFKTGGIIESDYDIIYEIPKVEEFQKGGKTKLGFEEWFNMIPEQNRALGYDYKKAHEVLDLETLYNHTKNPDKYHLYSVSPVADENGNYPFLKLGKLEENPELQGEFDWYNSEEGAEHKSKFDILFINDRYYYVPKKFKDGGKTKEELETPEIEETNQKNLIPEGALHKNKHHMEHTEGLTQKGIPVIDNDGEQLAEIELDEIIFTLEVTKKLEELYKDGSDKAAIEAGKLLVKEILFNTDDRTGLISKCEKGGKICQIEE